MTTLIGSIVIIVLLGGMLWLVRKAGKDAERAAIGKANADAAERIAKSQGSAPRDKSAVLGRLRDRKRRL